ncbi:MAG TPA: hypothetical protein VL523_09640 [Terriglobia bacterium]|nr:hypothetical protein [Terriglobia bacterium]
MSLRRLPEVEVGLCRACRHARVVRSDRGSVFYQCRLALTDPAFPAYPRLPVLRCAGYERPSGSPAESTGRTSLDP